MRIVIIHQYYLRQNQGGGARFNVMAKAWADAGHDVLVIAGQVDYHNGHKPRRYKRKWRIIERDNNVTIWRMHTPNTYAKSFLGRAYAMAGFAMHATVAAAIAKADLVLASSPSLLVAIPALMRKAIARTPLVFEVRDLWPESAVATGVLNEHQLWTQALYLLESTTYQWADAINAVTPAIAAKIREKTSTPVWYYPNGAVLQTFDLIKEEESRAFRTKMGWAKQFVLLYAGAHGLANDLQQMVEAATQLQNNQRIRFVAVGDGPQKQHLVAETKKRGLTNIQWLDAIPNHQMPLYFKAADVGLVILQKNETFKTVYPNKLFDAMAAQKAIICGVDGAARQLIEEAQCGVYTPPNDPSSLAHNILQLAHDPDKVHNLGQNGRRYVEEHFNRHTIAQDYLNALCTLLER